MKILGVLNVTPDSFSDGGHFLRVDDAIAQGLQLAAEGADWVDVGGESTRPGSDPVSAEEELARVLPVVLELVRRGVAVSIDSRKPEVARACLDAGATFLNDVTGFRQEAMRALALEFRPYVCLMHMQGEPKTMQAQPHYENVVLEVLQELQSTASDLESRGLPAERIFLDPGIGFGKAHVHNLQLLKSLPQWVAGQYPVLLGVSRKSFLGRILSGTDQPAPVSEREEGTLALHAYARLVGVQAIRTHDVLKSKRALRTLDAVLTAPPAEQTRLS